MYKYLLWWRYLRTRYIALASIISVMLGVATMIVVNAVMAGFADKMRDRIHGALSDIIVESVHLDGFADHDVVMARIAAAAGDQIEAMAPVVETFAMMSIITPSGEPITQNVRLIGVRPAGPTRIGACAGFPTGD